MAFDLQSLTTYVETNKNELSAALVATPKEFDVFANISGIIGQTTLPALSTDIVFQNGATCGFTPSGNDTISERILDPAIIKINKEWCPLDLIGSFAQHEVRITAGKEELPFENKIIESIHNRTALEIAKLFWQGDKTSGSGNLQFTDGLGTIIKADAASGVIDSKHVITKGSDNVYTRVKKLIKAMGDNVSTNIICMSKSLFTDLVFELVEQNNYHHSADLEDNFSMYFPHTNVKVIGFDGLAGDSAIYSVNPDTTFYGYNEKADFQQYRLWYSDDDDVIRYRVRLAVGAQYKFAEEVYVNK